jgi:predicted glutamine amidotransferase
MCLIVLKQPGQTFDLDQFKIAVDNNPDGYGLTFTNPEGINGKLKTIRSKNKPDAEALFKLMTEDLHHSHVLLHLRWNTSGKTTLRNAHPFPVLEHSKAGTDLRMAHNGHITKYHNKRRGDESDTRKFVRSFVRPLFERMSAGYYTDSILSDDFIQDLLEDECGSGSVLVFLSGDGDAMICNESKGWLNDSGVFFSNKYSFNTSHRTPVSTSTYVSRFFDDDDDWRYDARTGTWAPKKTTSVVPYSGPKSASTGTLAPPVHSLKAGDKVRHKHVSGLTGEVTACDGRYSSFVTVQWNRVGKDSGDAKSIRIHCDALEVILDTDNKSGYTSEVQDALDVVEKFTLEDLCTLTEDDFKQVLGQQPVALALFEKMRDTLEENYWNYSYLTKGA